jgi:UDP-N-acetylmuramoylalanine--D-glutamate ligase
MKDLNGLSVAVVGMKRSGVAAVELLLTHGAVVCAVDEKPISELGAEGKRLTELRIVPLRPQTEAAFKGVDLIVLSPGVPADLPLVNAARANGVAVIGEVELAGYFLQGPVIGITGSNGKTTTTAMIGHILKESGIPTQVGGNIGTAPTAMVRDSRPNQWNVLELSSFQLETISSFRVQISVCLNVTPDHLDRHYTIEKYAAAKGRLFENQTPEDYSVLNADDPHCVAYAANAPARPLWFSLSHPVAPGLWVQNGNILFDGEVLLPRADVSLRGLHNIENTMAAAAASRLAGATLEQIAAAVRTFPGVEHRLEFVREYNGINYYNDSKATNVDATMKALDAFPGGLWIILGGKDKNSDYTLLRDRLARKARGILLIGAAAAKITEQLGTGLPLVQCGTLEAAVEYGTRNASSGETVLLAPACASFDQFESYEHRGRVFKAAVMALGAS